MELTWNGRNWMEPGTGLNITRISYISINASVSTLNYVLSSDEQDPKYMHRCAGVCYSRGRGLYNRCNIELSQPLLSLRPRADLVNTLLHEMIHAFIFVTHE